jgi:molybdopterin synthase sulfur carrier subunit
VAVVIVQVRYFASIREALGAGEQVDLPEGGTAGALRERLIQRSAVHATALRQGRALRCAVDQVLSDESAVLSDGSEVAFFPPVTGG